MTIIIEVEGEPKSKGSMKAFAYKTKDGKLRANLKNANADTKRWQNKCALAIAKQMDADGIDEPLDCPVSVDCTFLLPRPKSVKRKHACHAYDLDKLQRVVGDALEGTLLKNDARICEWICTKSYSEVVGVYIKVKTL